MIYKFSIRAFVATIIRAWLLNEVEAFVAKYNFPHKFLFANNMLIIRELVNYAG